jgi:hypothetical protein
VRPDEVYRRAIAPDKSGLGGGNWIIEAEGAAVGYIFLRTPWGHAPQDRVREVVIGGEWAGSRGALVEALPLLVERLDLAELWLAVAWQDAVLARLLHERGVRGEVSSMPWHTMRILDFPGLMADMQDYVAGRLGEAHLRRLVFCQDGDHYAIACGSERLELDGAGMTRLVFGAPETPEVCPVDRDCDLGRIVDTLFPLPSRLPGLNCR